MRKLLWAAAIAALGGAAVLTPHATTAQTPPATQKQIRQIAGLQGAVKLPFTLKEEATVTLALYAKNGQLVRVLAQLLDLKAGDYEAAWDGMDLYGHLVPAGTDLTFRVTSNNKIRAVYEMSVASAGAPPWGGRSGEGDTMRMGGWLGDHSGPGALMRVGDRMFVGSFLVEHGHNFIATTANGEKIWGTQLAGWAGPVKFATDGQTLWAVVRGGNDVRRVDPKTFEIKPAFSSPDPIQAIAAHKNTLTVLLKNRDASINPLRRSSVDIDFVNSLPTAPPTPAPEHQIGVQARYAAVFKETHPQAGFTPVIESPTSAYAIAVFDEPVQIGTILAERIGGAEKVEYFTLKPGVKFNRDKHAPRKGGVEDDLGLAVGMSEDWERFGSSKFENTVEAITAPKAHLKTNALYIRIASNPKGDGKPNLRMVRLHPMRFNRLPVTPTVILPDNAQVTPVESRIVRWSGKAAGWDFKQPLPVTDINPINLVLDLGKTVELDGLSLQNLTNPQVDVDAFIGPDDADVKTASDDQWQRLTTHRTKYDRKAGHTSGSVASQDRQIYFGSTTKTRALRLRMIDGIKQRKFGISDDPWRTVCADVALLKLVDPLPEVLPNIVQVRDGSTGEVVSSKPAKADYRAIAFDPAGQLYGINANGLYTLTAEGDSFSAKPLVTNLNNAISLAVGENHIVVGDQGDFALRVFDKAGKAVATIGKKGPYKRGPYDSYTINKPTNVGIGPDGNIWLSEESYSPKRVAIFTPDGKHVRDFFGPPEYGGGGHLDPNLKAFYYRGQQFDIDFAKGTWRLAHFNDRLLAPESPTSDNSGFGYTRGGRVVVKNGVRYAMVDPRGGFWVARLVNNLWVPTAAIGGAEGNPFLVSKNVWRSHWLGQPLKGKSFVWCDVNGDGDFQVEEVTLFGDGKMRIPGGDYWGSNLGSDLTIVTGGLRWAPARFTDKGVPIYDPKDIQTYDRSSMWASYHANVRAGSLAKPALGGASIVASDGSVAYEGQPFRIGPDLKVVGGTPLNTQPSEFIPPIVGVTLDNPLSFVGVAPTKEFGDVAIMNGNNGHWFIWSVRDCAVVGWIFTGRQGGWGGVPDVRGTDVTHNKQAWETFFGHFLKADDGNYYVVAGKGHHAISRVEGLNDFQVTDAPVRITPEAFALNTQLRPALIQQAKIASKARNEAKELAVSDLDKRTTRFKFDGELEDWGGVKNMLQMDDPPPEAAPVLGQTFAEHAAKSGALYHIDAARDANGLWLAYSGVGVLKNSSEDHRFIFKGGFCIEVAIRSDPKARGKTLAAGDRRILFAPYKGKWVAVLFDYVDPAVPEDKYIDYESPVLKTRVARVELLPEDAFKIKVRSGYDLERRVPEGMKDFTAEIYLPWATLGFAEPPGNRSFKADFGILNADKSGTTVDQRFYWSNSSTEAVTDMALESAINPATLGTVSVGR